MTIPLWTLLPFAGFVLALAVTPQLSPRVWKKHGVQALVTAVFAAPVLVFCLTHGYGSHLARAGAEYASFIATLAALFVTAGGVHIDGTFEGSPRANVLFLLVGSLLASVVGTTGASMLLLRPFLRANARRAEVGHLLAFFILAVSNAGGLLTPIGDPPLLVGFLEGVPFFWTLRLLPVWLLYVGSFALGLYLLDRRAYARDAFAALAPRTQAKPFEVRGRRNVALLLLVPVTAFLPLGVREVALLAITCVSYFGTSREIRADNAFLFAPIIEVTLVFAGIFACLVPVELGLAERAHELPLAQSWQFFWVSGALSSVLDNAPTYAAMTALARGVSHGHAGLVAGTEPLLLAAVSVGAVVMGGTTYIGNGPNLMVRAVAEHAGCKVPSFLRYTLFAFAVMLPAHLVVTGAFVLLGR